MAIESPRYTRLFGGNQQQAPSKDDRAKAQFWLNIGYAIQVEPTEQHPDGIRFISLAQGIPLDTVEDLPTNSSNREFADFRAAQNDLREQLMSLAKTLQPGERRFLSEGDLMIELRRVREEVAPTASSENQFVRKLKLA